MRNEIIYDKTGRPDIMVTFTPDELGLPAELNGRAVKEYCISKYQNTLIDGVPHSLPYMEPATKIDHDEAIRLCESKGEGWHLMTNDEWAAITLKAWEDDTIPTGNTSFGKSHSHPEQHGTVCKYGMTLTGSGPIEWNHDRTQLGIADMVGNILEHVGGIRFLNGQVQTIPNHGAAAGADQSENSSEWQPILTKDGKPIYYNPQDGGIVLQDHEAEDKDWDGTPFDNLEAECDVPDQLIKLGLYPPEGLETENFFWVDNDGETIVVRGGYWNDGTGAGLFYRDGNNARSGTNTNIGFRSAYVRYSDDLTI